jgi:K+-transporting ATPase ATPase A chain
MLAVISVAEANPTGPAALAAGANLEGKEVRFGIPSSALFADSTTGTSTGAVNSLHDSFSAFGGGGALLNILFSEMTPGGVGTGLYSILVIAIVAVFLAGLMVGRTPEYLGKKIGRREVTCAAVVVLAMPALVLLGTGLAVVLPSTGDALGNSGAHGLSEVLYAFASATNNNGSAFGGLTVTDGFFQTALGVCMLLGRFVPVLAVLALAGSLGRQPRVEPGPGTLATDTPLFTVLVAGTVVLVAAITFFPALALSPLAEGLS